MARQVQAFNIFVCACLILATQAEGLSQSVKRDTDEAQPSKAAPSEGFLEDILNYPFVDNNDLNTVSERCVGLARTSYLFLDPKTREGFQRFLLEVVHFTSTQTSEAERLYIESFSLSKDKAVRKLREEIGLPPPEGGAVVRIYYFKRAMPEPVRELFREGVQGITRWCRFIAINAEGLGKQELEDVISHELAHAYISSSLGLSGDNLPRWFHEGVALYLSDARDVYVSQTNFGMGRIAWSPREYEEYKIAFKYIESRIGEQGTGEFIRRAVEGKSADEALRAIVGVSGYGELRSIALKAKADEEKKAAIIGYVIVGVVVLAISYVVRRSRRRKRLAAEIERSRAEEQKQSYLKKAAQDYEKLSETDDLREQLIHYGEVLSDTEQIALARIREGRALAKTGQKYVAAEMLDEAYKMALWSPIVRSAYKEAKNELEGIIK